MTSWAQTETVRFWISLIGLSLIGIGALGYEIRRLRFTFWEVVGSIAGAVGTVIGIGGILYLLNLLHEFLDREYRGLPNQVQTVVKTRIDLVVFLFWLVLLSFVTILGGCGLVASFALFSKDKWRNSRARLPLNPFSQEYWALVDRADQLKPYEKLWIWLHHEAYSLAVFALGCVGLPMAFGIPKTILGLYWAIALLAMLSLKPARSDKRRLERLVVAERRAQTESHVTIRT